jgi:hypothetical protein
VHAHRVEVSIEQMMMQLSRRSRTTSISNSFHPNRFLDQDFGGGRCIGGPLDDLEELGFV